MRRLENEVAVRTYLEFKENPNLTSSQVELPTEPQKETQYKHQIRGRSRDKKSAHVQNVPAKKFMPDSDSSPEPFHRNLSKKFEKGKQFMQTGLDRALSKPNYPPSHPKYDSGRKPQEDKNKNLAVGLSMVAGFSATPVAIDSKHPPGTMPPKNWQPVAPPKPKFNANANYNPGSYGNTSTQSPYSSQGLPSNAPSAMTQPTTIRQIHSPVNERKKSANSLHPESSSLHNNLSVNNFTKSEESPHTLSKKVLGVNIPKSPSVNKVKNNYNNLEHSSLANTLNFNNPVGLAAEVVDKNQNFIPAPVMPPPEIKPGQFSAIGSMLSLGANAASATVPAAKKATKDALNIQVNSFQKSHSTANLRQAQKNKNQKDSEPRDHSLKANRVDHKAVKAAVNVAKGKPFKSRGSQKMKIGNSPDRTGKHSLVLNTPIKTESNKQKVHNKRYGLHGYHQSSLNDISTGFGWALLGKFLDNLYFGTSPVSDPSMPFEFY